MDDGSSVTVIDQIKCKIKPNEIIAILQGKKAPLNKQLPG